MKKEEKCGLCKKKNLKIGNTFVLETEKSDLWMCGKCAVKARKIVVKQLRK